MRKLIAGLALFTAIAGCSRATTSPTEVRVDQSIDLALGEAARVRGSDVTVRFAGAQDSRCPSDVVCVTAGDANIALVLAGAGAERADTVHLNREPRSTVYGGYRFAAEALTPYPKSTGMGADKTLTLRVTRQP